MRARRRVKACAVAAIFAAGLALGCLGRSPQVRFYTMSAVSGAPFGPISDLAIGLGPAQIPRYLDRPQLVTRGEASELEFDDFNRWAGGFGPNVLRALGDDLASRLGTERVVVYPASAPFPLAYRVSLDIHEFEARPGRELVLRARWAIRIVAEEGKASSGQIALRSELARRDVESLVAAHDQALGLLADAITRHIAGLELSANRTDDVAGAEAPRGS